MPHRRHPAGHGGRRGRAATRPTGLAEDDLPDGYRELLAFRYGHAARNVLQIAGSGPALAAPIVAGQPDLLAEAVVAARLEQARSVADVLLRRTRLGLLAAPQLRDRRVGAPRSPRRWAASWAGTPRGSRAEAEAWVADAAAEGIDPANGVSSSA